MQVKAESEMSSLAESMLTTGQAARELSVSPDWVRKLVKQGILPAIETPLGRLIPADAVEALRKERELANAS